MNIQAEYEIAMHHKEDRHRYSFSCKNRKTIIENSLNSHFQK